MRRTVLLLATLALLSSPAQAQEDRPHELPRGVGYSLGVAGGIVAGIPLGVAGLVAASDEPDCTGVPDHCGSLIPAYILGVPGGLVVGGIDGAMLAYTSYRARSPTPWLVGLGAASVGGILIGITAGGDHTAWTNTPPGIMVGTVGLLTTFVGAPIAAGIASGVIEPGDPPPSGPEVVLAPWADGRGRGLALHARW